MTAGRRDLSAARTCLIAWLASIGFFALGVWGIGRWGSGILPDRLWSDEYDYRHALNGAAAGFVLLFALFWLLVFLLGTARLRADSRAVAKANALFVAALLAALVLCLLHAAPALFATWTDACMRNYLRAHPGDGCLDCGIHRCDAHVAFDVILAGTLIVAALMAASLWLRWKAR